MGEATAGEHRITGKVVKGPQRTKKLSKKTESNACKATNLLQILQIRTSLETGYTKWGDPREAKTPAPSAGQM